MQNPHADSQLEQYINAAWKAINAAATETDMREAAQRMADLIGQRTPDRIAQMEREQGLR